MADLTDPEVAPDSPESMAPKRKSSTTALSTSFYMLPGSSSSKKRLVHDEDEQEGAARSSISSNTTTKSQPQTQYLTSPSLENLTTNLGNLGATLPPSIMTTPITPASTISTKSYRSNNIPLARPKTYLIVGASRGIGLEFARQLLLQSHQVIAVVRNMASASQLWQVTGSLPNIRPGSCIIEQCDVGSSADIDSFVARMRLHVERGGGIDTVVLNAGILEYEAPGLPGTGSGGGIGSLGVEFEVLERHLRVNCVGNIVLARKLLQLNELAAVKQWRHHAQLQTPSEDSVLIARQIVFMSSDSASMADFREYEDGFAAYGASKAALNMMIRHMAAELRRRGARKEEEARVMARNDWQSITMAGAKEDATRAWENEVCVVAMHPGEVSTDMANIELGWEVEGVITAEESVKDMLGVLAGKDARQSGTFWRWDGGEHPW